MMRPRTSSLFILLCTIAAAGAAGMAARAQAPYPRTDEHRAWNEPFEPFRIIGPIYYVGTADLASYLIASDAGHILLDTGLEADAAQLVASIERLGFELRDIKVLINSQAHFDHAAGFAELKKRTGARLLASDADARALEAGGAGDFAFDDQLTFPKVAVDGRLTEGQVVTVGPLALTARLTPGHTKGTTTWTMTVRDGGKELRVAFVGSTSVISRSIGGSAYPEQRRDYERTFATLKSLRPDVFLGQHAGFTGLAEKYARLKAGAAPNPFIDPDGYLPRIARSEEAFRQHP